MPSTYLIAYGIDRRFRPFAADPALALRRGDRVILRTARGIEMGDVMCPLPPGPTDEPPGLVLRIASEEDHAHHEQLAVEAQGAIALAEQTALDLRMPMQIVDVEAIADPKRLVFHVVFDDLDVRPLVSRLSTTYEAFVDLINLAKPRAGGCGSCGSGGCGSGGCGSCGDGGCGSGCAAPLAKTATGEPGWIEYFSELRLKMNRRNANFPL